ncbi:MAG TPA: amidohydrolase family protein [Acidimicrobiales bacterium]|nr:amidohydrolase family protein [Acidimicrobiales bacterium]
MLQGMGVIDADAHVLEPDDLWDRYLDKRFAAFAPKTRRIAPGHPYYAEYEFCGVVRGRGGVRMDTVRSVNDGHGGRITVMEAYAPYINAGFSAASYVDFMDMAGIDHMLVYPTIGLPLTALPNVEPRLAAAVKRAYNSWLSDWCAESNGRIHGVAALDLRDIDLAIAEARRCVNELGFRSVYILPDPPFEGMPLDHPAYDELWAEVVVLGVPLGTHEGIAHSNGAVGFVGAKHVSGSRLPYAGLAASFGLGEMVAAMLFTGGICARHPDLRVVFTESSVGWVATWLDFLDEKWEGMHAMGHPVADQPPSWYFKRQCFISGESGEEGYRYAVEAGYEDCLLAASDFPHPEGPDFPHAMGKFFDGAHVRLDTAVIRKILWDTPACLYGF